MIKILQRCIIALALTLTIALTAALTTNISYAEGTQSLSPDLRSLLNKEMQALQSGMQALIPAYVAGDMVKIAAIAKNMKESYILKQSITNKQKHELMEKLPKAFLHLDKQFHQRAGMLEHVAQERHSELVGFYYGKLLESCVGCHSQHASHRFTALKKPADDHGHHH